VNKFDFSPPLSSFIPSPRLIGGNSFPNKKKKKREEKRWRIKRKNDRGKAMQRRSSISFPKPKPPEQSDHFIINQSKLIKSAHSSPGLLLPLKFLSSLVTEKANKTKITNRVFFFVFFVVTQFFFRLLLLLDEQRRKEKKKTQGGIDGDSDDGGSGDEGHHFGATFLRWNDLGRVRCS
jgi:hypothetical protein